jgi:tetratricopeptide (TPR) repeat protein
MAGIGKSMLAARAVDRARGRYHLFWHRGTAWDTLPGLVARVTAFLQEAGRTRTAVARRRRGAPPSELLAPLAADLRDFPALLVFDDVHKLPDDALPFLAMTLEAARGTSTTLLLVSRELPRFYGRGDAAPGGPVVEVELGGLGPEEARALLPALPPEEVERRYAVTHGHPLFLRLLTNGSSLEGDVTRYVEQEIYAHASPEERRVLHALAVHRLPVAVDALPGPAPVTIATLKDRGVVREAVGFELHDLVRDFVYSRIGREERLALHREAAAYWRPREPAEALHHTLESEDWGRAAALSVEVIPVLVDTDPGEAWRLLEQLDETSVPADVWPDQLFLRGLAREKLGDPREALRLYQEVLTREGGSPDKGSLAMLHGRIAAIQREVSGSEATLESHREALRLYEESRDWDGAALELASMAAVHRQLGETARAREHLRRGLEYAEKAKSDRARAMVEYQAALTDRASGALREAAARFQVAEGLAARSGDVVGRILVMAGLMEVEFLRGRRAQAEKLAAEVRAATTVDATRTAAREALLGFARLLAAAGDERTAYKHALEAAKRPSTGMLRKAVIARVDLEAKSLAASLAAWSLARPALVGREKLEQALDAERRGDLETALSALDEAQRVLSAAGESRGLVAVNITWGRVHEKREDLDAAEERYGEAARLAASASDLLGRARALAALGEVTGPRGRKTLEEARALYAQLGRRAEADRVASLLRE